MNLRTSSLVVLLISTCPIDHFMKIAAEAEAASLGWKLWFLKYFSSCRRPQLFQDSRLLFLCPQSRQRENQPSYSTESGRWERAMGFQWLDWRGFGPLNRSTCSSGISRKQDSILVHWACLPITVCPAGRLGGKQGPRDLISGQPVCENRLYPSVCHQVSLD